MYLSVGVVCRLILFGFLMVGVLSVRVPGAHVEVKSPAARAARSLDITSLVSVRMSFAGMLCSCAWSR